MIDKRNQEAKTCSFGAVTTPGKYLLDVSTFAAVCCEKKQQKKCNARRRRLTLKVQTSAQWQAGACNRELALAPQADHRAAGWFHQPPFLVYWWRCDKGEKWAIQWHFQEAVWVSSEPFSSSFVRFFGLRNYVKLIGIWNTGDKSNRCVIFFSLFFISFSCVSVSLVLWIRLSSSF